MTCWRAGTGFGATLRRPLRILLVEDERKVAKALQEGFEAESYSIAVVHTGKDEGVEKDEDGNVIVRFGSEED